MDKVIIYRPADLGFNKPAHSKKIVLCKFCKTVINGYRVALEAKYCSAHERKGVLEDFKVEEAKKQRVIKKKNAKYRKFKKDEKYFDRTLKEFYKKNEKTLKNT